MKNVLLCMCTAFIFFVASAVAQTPTDSNSAGSQGTQGSSPSMSGQTGSTSPNNRGTMSQGSTPGNTSSNGSMAEKKMKGCIESQGGQYMLQTKKGKDVMLTGQDVSAHVGHEVTVHGMWEGGSSAMSSTSSGSGAASKSFNVTSVDMISDTCSMGKGKSGMSGSSGMSGGGMGSTGASTGSSSGSNGTGSATTPPQ